MAITDSEPKYRYRAKPQVSASQMAEYLGATSTRRRSIIQSARFPKTSVTAQYGGAREGLVKFMNDRARSYSHIAAATDQLQRRSARATATDWVKRDGRYSIEAMEAFQRGYNRFTVLKADCRAVHGRQPALDMWPTKISVALDVTIHKPDPEGGPDQIGGAILLFSKGESSSKARIERSRCIAGLILTYCNRFLTAHGEPDPQLCVAVDIFGGKMHRPQGTFAKKLRNVEDSCNEIATLWKTVPPPHDYDGPDF